MNLNPKLSIMLCALLWSAGGILIKSVDWNAYAIAGMRSLIAAIFIIVFLRKFPVFLIRAKTGLIDKKQTLFCFLGAVFYSFTMIGFVIATKMTTAANAIFLQYTSPIYVILLSPLLLKERNSFVDYISVLGVFLGMVLFMLDGIHAGNMLGNFIAALSGISFAMTAIFMRAQKNYSPVNSFILANIITFILMFPFYWTDNLPSRIGVICIIIMGCFQIGLPVILYSIGIKKVTAMSATLITLIEPIMNPVWVVIFKDEIPSIISIAGGIIVLGFILFRTVVKTKN
jgi:drug/metabolite transporter (DMT)-like permease